MIDRQPSLRQAGGHRLAFEVLDHQVIDTLLLAHVIEGADVRVIERGDAPRLTLESIPGLRCDADLCRQDLDCHRAIEARVARLVDFAHAARSNRGQNLVGAEAGAGNEGHRTVYVV